MLFNSLVFLFLFLPVTYFVFWFLKTTPQRHVWLMITGYVFYGYWDPRFCLLMAFSTLVSYLAGLGFLKYSDPRTRKLLLVIPITIDLLLLGFFKYAGFTARSLNDAFQLAGVPWSVPVLDIILPIGISFYTFHTISYIVDAYRRDITPTRSLFEFSAYVSLFSQLVAGPIVRFRQIEKDLENLATADRWAVLPIGLSFFTFGLIEKVVIADSLAHFVDPWLADYASLSTGAAWLAMMGYTMQLYFDFCGYSSMAVGLGLMFGLRIPQNFNSPYRARDPSDFWRRWHISLSTCMRDYIYKPLGGNRDGNGMMYRNLMLTMLIGGLWHGASWTFILWGAYHGALLVVYRLGARAWDALPTIVASSVMFVLVLIGWVLFRATDTTMALAIYSKMFIPTAGIVPEAASTFAAIIGLATVWATVGPNVFEFHERFKPTAWRVAATATAGGIALAMITGVRPSPFLYFQF